MILIILCLLIAIWRKCTDKQPISSQNALTGTNLYRRIAVVLLIQQVLERNDRMRLTATGSQAIVPFRYCNKTHIIFLKSFLYQLIRTNTLPGKSGQIFYNNAVKLPRFHGCHHPLKLWSVKITSTVTVINKNIHQFQIIMGIYKSLQQKFLVGNTVTFLLLQSINIFISLRQSQINSCSVYINLFLTHYNSSCRSSTAVKTASIDI